MPTFLYHSDLPPPHTHSMDSEEEQDWNSCGCFAYYFNCRSFLKSHTLRDNPLEFAGFMSFWCIAFGLGLIFIGFGIPRDYTFDPDKPARQMEEIENYYSDLGFGLDICSIVGMGLVTLGGLIVANATFLSMLIETFWEQEPEQLTPSAPPIRREDIPLHAAPGAGKTYGSQAAVEPTAPPISSQPYPMQY